MSLLAAGAAIAFTDVAPATADPILAAIKAHAKAYAELDEALARQEVLERPLLGASPSFDEDELFDDPTWVALQLELDSLHEAEMLAAMALIRIVPSTGAGMVALTQHVAAFARQGYQWPANC
ncbi:MAG TPA: hypothetical protein VMU69_12905 [Bradyrhizobium sp.]|nr:hypothetical protein [Bradyrhizobium sp.]